MVELKGNGSLHHPAPCREDLPYHVQYRFRRARRLLQPMLVLGAICGGLYGNLAAGLGLLPPEYRLHMVVFAMASFFTGSVRAPVTGILLLLELTGRFYHMVPLGIVTLLPMLQVNCSAIGPSLTLFSKMTLRSASRKRPKRTSCSAIPMFMKLLWKAVPLLKAKA